eukprot:c13475_g1_i1 orf=196-1038(-)
MASASINIAKRLAGKVAIITGGASGIGETSVRLFVENGARVVIADIQDEKGVQLANQMGSDAAAYKHCDTTQERDVEALVAFALQKWGKLDIMFNNAGILGKCASHEVASMDMADFDHVISVNVRGMVLGVKHASKAMVDAKSKGSIICTSSTSSVTGGLAPVPYTVSKHAVLGLMRSASSDLGKHGIRVNCISPAAVVTPLALRYLREASSNPSLTIAEAQRVFNEGNNLAGHCLSTLDIAHASLYLASDDAAFVSGLNLVVDGGITATTHVFQSSASS